MLSNKRNTSVPKSFPTTTEPKRSSKSLLRSNSKSLEKRVSFTPGLTSTHSKLKNHSPIRDEHMNTFQTSRSITADHIATVPKSILKNRLSHNQPTVNPREVPYQFRINAFSVSDHIFQESKSYEVTPKKGIIYNLDPRIVSTDSKTDAKMDQKPGVSTTENKLYRLDLNKIGFSSDQVNKLTTPSHNLSLSSTHSDNIQTYGQFVNRSSADYDYGQTTMLVAPQKTDGGLNTHFVKSNHIRLDTIQDLLPNSHSITLVKDENLGQKRLAADSTKDLINQPEIEKMGYDRFDYRYKLQETSKSSVNSLYNQRIYDEPSNKINESFRIIQDNEGNSRSRANYALDNDVKNYRKLWGLASPSDQPVPSAQIQSLYKLDAPITSTENGCLLAGTDVLFDFSERKF